MDFNEALSGISEYQTWFAYMQSRNRLRVLNPTLVSTYLEKNNASIDDIYITAAYLSNMNLVLSAKQMTSATDVLVLEKWGLTRIDIEETSSSLHDLASVKNPIKTIVLKTRGNLDHSVITKYFSNENRVVFYDKYINEESMRLIESCVLLAKKDLELNVITTSLGGECLDKATILQRLSRLKPSANIKVEYCNQQTRKKFHDRHIFIGDRIQLTFSRGLDVFGSRNTAGGYQNKAGEINFYDISDMTRDEFHLVDGTIIYVNKYY